MKKFLATIAIAVLSAALAGCGGGSSSGIVPDAQAAEPVSACPTGDATAQLQAMVDSAKGSLSLPACVFNTSAPITIRKPLRLTCSGATVEGTIIRSSADEALVIDPDVRVSVASGFNKRGWWGSVEDCRIEPGASGGGKHALVLRARPGFFISMTTIRGNHLGGFGEQGLYLDNSAGNADGIFSTTVERNFIENGAKGVSVGDSVHFIDNVVTNGVNRFGGNGLPGFDLSFVSGAAETVIERNNITTGGGCVLIRNGTGVGVINNWCESSSAGGASGLIQLANCAECTVRDNRVQTLGGDAPYALVLDGGELTVIDSNKLNIGTSGHIAFVNGAKQNKLVGLNRFIGGGDAVSGKIVGGDAGLIH